MESPIVTRDRLLHIAKLARLRLSDTELDQLERDLRVMVDYVRMLQEVDTGSSLDPGADTHEPTHLRADVVGEHCSRSEVLGQAPHPHEGCFGVPRIVQE